MTVRIHSSINANKVLEFDGVKVGPGQWVTAYRDGVRTWFPAHRIAFIEEDDDVELGS